MIALPGLTLSTGRFDVAREILLEFSNCVDQGMLPNVFPDAGDTPEYNTVDATLWFFEAARQYLEHTGDAEFIRTHLYGKLKDIIDWHVRGTRYGIHVDSDGLLIAGDSNTQLTWMDARVDGRAVTPRSGKPVEIQALWYNALRFTARLAHEFGDENARASLEVRAGKAAAAFAETFWNEETGWLYMTTVDGHNKDRSLRPNQLIALSLGYCAIPEDRARRIIAAAERHLLTPFGLRTLALFRTPACTAPAAPARFPNAMAPIIRARSGSWLLGPFFAADARPNGRCR